MNDFLLQAAIYLGAGAVAVPLAHRLGLGSVLGYLVAGILIAPLLERVGSDHETVQHFAEFGVVMMLFLIGLELQPGLLWSMRSRLFGLGGAQVLLTALVIATGLLALGLAVPVAVALGLILALSSTAIVLQTLGEKKWLRTEGGQSAFGVLLFQDIAVIPILALLPFLAIGAGGESASGSGHASASLIADYPAWAQAILTLSAVALVILVGRYLTRPAFRVIARTGLRELFLGSALLLVILIAMLMSYVGLSPALGTFLAGVVLADSEYRHELESDLASFKGLLLGVFFITVGAGIDFDLLTAQPVQIVSAAVALIALKGAILWLLGTAFGLRQRERWLFSMSLAQAGEFAFVLLTFAVSSHVLAPDVAAFTSLVVALSMLATPALLLTYEHVVAPRVRLGDAPERGHDTIEEEGSVIIAGMGRFGQIVQRMLVMTGHKPIVLDSSAEHIDSLRKFGIDVYYGDAVRPDMLVAAGIANAKLFIVAIDDRERAVELVDFVHRRYPQVRILARAADRDHVYRLCAAGADTAFREMFGSSVAMAKSALVELGHSQEDAERKARAFDDHDTAGLRHLMEVWDAELDVFSNPTYIARAKSRADEFAELMAQDEEERERSDNQKPTSEE